MWEDENCKNGGRYLLRIPKSYSNKYWEDLVLAFIGEQFSFDKEVLGLVVHVKPQADMIAIWTRNADDNEKLEKIKEDINRIVKIDEQVKLEYNAFADAAN